MNAIEQLLDFEKSVAGHRFGVGKAHGMDFVILENAAHANLVQAAVAEYNSRCVWTQQGDEYGDVWDASCGKAWVFDEGGPSENEVTFCPFCGRRIAIAVIQADDEVDDDDD